MVKNRKTTNKEEEVDENIESLAATSTADVPLTPEATERIIHVIVNSIENVVRREPIDLSILVYHNERLLGESQSMRIEPDFREPPSIYPIDFSARLSLVTTIRSNIDSMVSTPLLIQLAENQDSEEDTRSVSSGPEDGSKKNKTKTVGKKSAESEKTKIVGICNIDILPMLSGEQMITERLIVELPKQSSTSGGISWMNLPILTVTMKQDNTNVFPSDFQVNYLSVTVESIYNPPINIAETFEHKAATVIRIGDENSESVFFDHGKLSKNRDLLKTKRWTTLTGKLEGRAALSRYKIDADYENTKNQLNERIDLTRIVEDNNSRIEWNCLSRHLLLGPDQQAMEDNITKYLNKYRYWPFQFMISSNVTEVGKSKSKDFVSQFYQCYADVSELLYPGKRQTRVATQLYSYNPSDMMEKTGLEKLLFNIEVPIETKQKEKKGKISTKPGSSINTAQLGSTIEPSYPIINELGEPVFVIVEFELKKPLVASRTMHELTQELAELLGPPDQLPPYPYTGDLAEEQFNNCIRKLVETITESYRDFDDEDNGCDHRSGNFIDVGGRYPYISDEIDRFTQYLYDTGNYTAIQTTLRNKIILLLDQKFKVKSCMRDSGECQNFVATAYVYLVEQMHVALNTASVDEVDSENPNPGAVENLCYCAEENYELGNIAQSRNNYVNLITINRKNPEAWLKYAIFSMKLGDEERALECCREAIKLDSRNKIALLLHGAVLGERKNYEAAEIFLKATTQLYPRFAEGWAVLHLFYDRIEYFQGVDLTIRVAEQCLKDEYRDTIAMDCLEKEPLSWSTIHCPKDRVYLTVAVFLLKSNLFDFAGISLAKELSLTGRTIPWLYYMAVHHYLLGRYDDALTHLEEARQQHGMDYSISGLMGHCHWHRGDIGTAIECYEFASALFNRPADIHLIDLRLGNDCLNVEKYDRAKRFFFGICKTSPTVFTWLGLGIACYHMLDFTDAERALTEANRLDHKNPEIWAYLCLLNMTLNRYEEFAECYRRMIKNDLRSEKLLALIKNTMESLGLSAPMLPSTTSENFIIEESS